ncbi:MAG: hypothetical protein AAGF53_11430 [Pseudomonadota bacterium]
MAWHTFCKTTALTVSLALFSAPALAEGDIEMASADGAQLKIKCDSTSCLVKEKKAGAKWKTIERTGGGRSAFKELKAKYQEAGFN